MFNNIFWTHLYLSDSKRQTVVVSGDVNDSQWWCNTWVDCNSGSYCWPASVSPSAVLTSCRQKTPPPIQTTTHEFSSSDEKEDQGYLSLLFSATLRGISLSILTLSLTVRFRRLFTSCSLLLAVTQRSCQCYSTSHTLQLLRGALLTLWVRGVLLAAVASYARSGRTGQIFDGGSALPVSA